MTELLFVILMIALFVVLLAVVFDSVITTKEYRIKTAKLAKPLRIAFLPDLLSDDSPSRLIRVVRKTAALHPDIVIVCGIGAFIGINVDVVTDVFGIDERFYTVKLIACLFTGGKNVFECLGHGHYRVCALCYIVFICCNNAAAAKCTYEQCGYEHTAQ